MATANGLGTLLSSRLAPREEEEEDWGGGAEKDGDGRVVTVG